MNARKMRADARRDGPNRDEQHDGCRPSSYTNSRASSLHAAGARPVSMSLAALAFVTALAGTGYGDGMIIPRPWPRPTPRPQVPPSIKFHRVKVEIAGRIATTSVDQVFVNPNNRAMEGEYIFPIPENASVSRFTLDIDGQTVEAELLDAKKARRIYEDIVRRQKDPALLEYAGRGIFRARIFPIPPRGERRITLRYEEQVRRDGSLFAYRYPLNTEKFSSRPIDEVAVDVTLGGDHPVRTIVCASHPGEAKVRRERNGTGKVSLVQRRVLPEKDFVLYYGLGGDIAVDLVAHRKSGEDGYFMLAISPPPLDDDGEGRHVPRAKDVVFVVDTSGSMAGDKLDQAKDAIRYCLNSLSPGDGFNVVRFSTEAEAFRDALVPASRGNVQGALGFVTGFRARGGTAIEEALLLALDTAEAAQRPSGRPLMVAFLTDGRPTIGERDADTIVKKVTKANRSKARVFVFGVGNDLNTKLLDRLSDEGRGSRTYVAPNEDIEVAVSGFYDRIASPVLTDLMLEFGPGLRVKDVYPRELGDLFRGDEIVVYGRYRGEFGSHVVTLVGRTQEREERLVFETGFPGEMPENALIARLWAMRKIGYLLDDIRLHGETKEVKAEVVRLSRKFGILTPYTSMLVLEDEADAAARPGRHGGRRGTGGPRIPVPAASARPEEARMKREVLGGARESGAAAVDASKAFDRLRKGRLAEKEMLEGVRQDARSQVKHLEDKTFYLRDGVWWDSAVDAAGAAAADMKRKKVKYLSDDYFELLRKLPRLGRYFALGERVVVVFDGTTYEVAP